MSREASLESRDQFVVRSNKRHNILEAGEQAYNIKRTNVSSIGDIRATTDFSALEPNTTSPGAVTVAGRVMRFRCSGKISFAVVRDGRGENSSIQLLVSRAAIGDDAYARWKKIDLGDHVTIVGEIGVSASGEASIFVSSWQLASKSLRPMPNLEHDMSTSNRFRQRYLDFMISDEARNLARFRTAIVKCIRATLDERDYMEVETPILQTERGGANARPFETSSNALGIDLFLRIAPELYLKRAVVGGFDRVYEIGKDFRNEGIDATHSPEFTMLEAYEAYSDYVGMMEVTESICRRAAELASSALTSVHEETVSLMLSEEPWQQISLFDSLSKVIGLQISPFISLPEIQQLCDQHNVEFSDSDSIGKLVEELWEKLVLPGLGNAPVFVCGFPISSSPLVAESPVPGVVEKWDLYVNGVELATGYSELIDPVIQRQRLEDQLRLADGGDNEAMTISEDFLLALEHGCPPMGGIGLGVDRLIALLAGESIRATTMFPLVRPISE